MTDSDCERAWLYRRMGYTTANVAHAMRRRPDEIDREVWNWRARTDKTRTT